MPLNKLPRLRNPLERDFVHEVRNKFLDYYKEEDPKLFYEEDVKLVEDYKFLLQRCIIYKRKNVQDSLNMLISMLKWRKERRFRELRDYNFPIEYYMASACFLYEPDKFGNRTLYVRATKLRNIAELKESFKEYLAYLVYQIDDCVEGQSWSVVMDLTNMSWCNYDIDLLMHFLTLLKEYFPVSIDYVLAINFPWIFSTAWTVVKRFIPPERRDVVVFISNKEIFNYIEKENVPDFLHGTCKRDYTMTPKNCTTIVEYLLQLEPKVNGKRIKEIIDLFCEALPKEHGKKMHKELENSGRK